MMKNDIKLYWLIFVLTISISCAHGCPSVCTCNQNGDAVCNMNGRQSSVMLTGFSTNNTSTLTITKWNTIQTLSHNIMSQLQVPNLQKLSIQHSRIQVVTGFAFQTFKKLTSLDLSNNEIVSITKDTFAGLQSLLYLDLSHNQISNIKHGTFDHIQQLLSFNIANNDLKAALVPKVFVALRDLKSLTLDNNRLSALSYITTGLTSLQNLHLRNCSISFLPSDFIQELSDLESIHVENNNIATIPADFFQNKQKLKHVYFNGNNLQVLKTRNFIGLQLDTLSLSNVKLKHVMIQPNAFENVTIKFLDLSANNVMFDDIQVILEDKSIRDNLVSLSLAHNPLFSTNGTQFPEFHNLQYINLSSTTLSEDRISSKMIQHWTDSKLKVVDMSLNNITFMPESILKKLNQSTLMITLILNPWHCDCKLRPFIAWLKLTHHHMSSCLNKDGKDLCYCNTPMALKNKSLTSLTSEDLQSCSTDIITLSSDVQTGIIIFSVILVVVIVLLIMALVAKKCYDSQKSQRPQDEHSDSRFIDTSKVIVNQHAHKEHSTSRLNGNSLVGLDATDLTLDNGEGNDNYAFTNMIIQLDDEIRVRKPWLKPSYPRKKQVDDTYENDDEIEALQCASPRRSVTFAAEPLTFVNYTANFLQDESKDQMQNSVTDTGVDTEGNRSRIYAIENDGFLETNI